MKKILLPFDRTEFSEGAFEFARQLNIIQPVLPTGIFIPQLSYANLWSYTSAIAGSTLVPLLEDEDTDLVQQNIDRFKQLCENNNIAYQVHKDFFDFALPELKHETRFADLLILSSETFYKGIKDADDYIKDALHAAECPVIVVPEKFHFPQKNILAYNGSEASVFAIKQYAYLFPELSHQPTVLVYSSQDNEEAFPYEDRIKEWIQQHFIEVSILKIEDSKQHFSTWVNENKNSILISGYHGRSSVWELFKKNFVNEIIAEHKLPVFIAHR